MGHAALGIRVSPPRSGDFLLDPPDSDPDPGADQGFSWCPDGLTEQAIDRLYRDLLASPDGPSGPPDGDAETRLFALPARHHAAISAGHQVIAGGEAA